MATWAVIAHSTTIASAMLDITGLDLSSYKVVRGFITDAVVAGDDLSVVLQLYLAGSLTTAGYRYQFQSRKPSVGSTDGNGSGEAVMWTCPWQSTKKVSNNSNAAYACDFYVSDPATASLNRFIHFTSSFSSQGSSQYCSMRGICGLDATGAITGFRVKTFDGAGLSSARLLLMGLG